MDYAYVGYTDDYRIVKGKVSAVNEEAAIETLGNIGYQVANLKPVTPFAPSMGGLFLGGVLLARGPGTWRNAITDEEYAHRIRTIDSPAYAHDKGRVPSRQEWEAAEAAVASTAATSPMASH